MPDDLSDTTVVRWIPDIPEAFSIVLKGSNAPARTDANQVHPLSEPTIRKQTTTPVAIHEEVRDCTGEQYDPSVKINVDTSQTQALSASKSKPTRKNLVTSDYLDMERRRNRGETWAQINRAFGREVKCSFWEWNRRTKPIHTQRRKPRTWAEFKEIEQRRDRRETWKKICAIHGATAQTSYYFWRGSGRPTQQQRQPHAVTTSEQLTTIHNMRVNTRATWSEIGKQFGINGNLLRQRYERWKWSGRPTQQQRQPHVGTTSEQLATIHDLRVNNRATWPEIGEQFGVSATMLRKQYERWKRRQGIDRREPYDAHVNSFDTESCAGSTECETATVRTLFLTKQAKPLATSYYMGDPIALGASASSTSISFDKEDDDDQDTKDDYNTEDGDTIVVQRTKDPALSLLCQFES